ATTINSESVRIDLEDSSVRVKVDVKRLTTQKFTYLTSYPVSDVRARSGGKPLDCRINDLAVGSEILCNPTSRRNFTVTLRFRAYELVSRQGKTRIFRYTQSIYRPTQKYRLKVLLPRGAVLLQGENVSTPVISPPGGEVSSNGRRIFVTWKMNPKLGETLQFQTVYETLSRESNYLYYVLAAGGTVLAALIAYLGYLYWSRESIETVYDELSEDEVEILEIMRDQGGKILQKELVRETDYSKAKISGIVRGLEEKDIIGKEKEGRSNRLVISRKYRS
ncbi:MAG: helix-turn-helix transcriptional regulator, partial [Candidatus Aenigmatarchaeota archaeon]